MAALFKYFVGIAAILPVVMFVMVLSAVNMGEMFVGIAAITQAPATETARWNIELLMAEPDRRYDVHGSLSPIYPATPGNEPLGKPVYTGHRSRARSSFLDTEFTKPNLLELVGWRMP
ncbi:MAG: hypothetical protein WBE42_27520 [Pseudolabrys sp.]